MGCFSYLCKNCGKAILSDSFSGEPSLLVLLDNNSNPIESMCGDYNSYGGVFDKKNRDNYLQWSTDWDKIVDMHFSKNKSGILAYHTRCIPDVPDGKNNVFGKEYNFLHNSKSENDPNQGCWL